MTIKFFGYSYFRIDIKNITIALDPFEVKDTNIRPPYFHSDILLLSSPNSIEQKPIFKDSFVIKGGGEIEKEGIFIEGITTHYYHNDKKEDYNNIYLIEHEEVIIVDLGHLQHGQYDKLKDASKEKISSANILLLPVGNKDSLDAKEAASIANQIAPKIIIPYNYYIPDGKIKLDPLANFLKLFEINTERLSKLSINKNKLPSSTKLIILENERQQ